VGASTETLLGDEGKVPLMDLLEPRTVAIVAELAEVLEQGRGYWERTSDARGVLAPPAVFKALGKRCHALVDINGFSATNASDRVARLPVANVPAFDEELPAAFGEVAALASDAGGGSAAKAPLAASRQARLRSFITRMQALSTPARAFWSAVPGSRPLG
jgi:hypothetical protein